MINEILAVTFIVSIFTFTFWGFLGLLPKRKYNELKLHSLTVLIPAHDEQKCIHSTIECVQEADYSGPLEILVVNDGSKDNTKDIVLELSKADSRIRLIDTEHLGKAKAVNRGVIESSGEIIILLDADSNLKKDALIKMSIPFSDPKVGAASGIIRVVVEKNLLVWYQEFEYILSSMWRFIFDKLNCTYVLPGFAAFRRSALDEVGGFETDTLSEDFDIGLKLHRTNWNLVMSEAIMFTNVPQTLGGLAKQRLRWGHGTIQVIRKHKDMLFNPKYGFIGLYGLPNQIYFFVQSFFILPITFYQIFGGYIKYFVTHGNYISYTVFKYFFSSFTLFGTIEFVYKSITGIWPMNWLFPLFLVSFTLNQLYNILAVGRMSKFNHRTVVVLFLLFPYYLYTLLFFIYPLILELNPLTRMRGHINIWEKTR